MIFNCRYVSLKPIAKSQDTSENGEPQQKFESETMIKQISEITSAIVGLSYEEKEEKVTTENPKITQFFQEADAKKTYRLSYNEALVQAENNPDGLDCSNVKKLDISVPGTPVSSRHLYASKNKNDDGNSSEISEYEVIELPDSEEVKYLAQKLVLEIESLVAKNDAAAAKEEVVSDGSIEILNTSEAVTPNSPKHLEVEILITQADEIDNIYENEDHDLQTINEVDEPSQGKNESKDYENSESSLTPATSTASLEPDQDQINFDLNEELSKPSKVQKYFDSAANSSYQRGFSEIEKFNEIPAANKEKIEEYFEASKEKQTLQRTFSQALNYVPPKISIEELLVPGCPISSTQVIELKVCGKKSDAIDAGADKITTPKIEEKSAPLLVDEYFNKSEERKTYRLDFSEAFKELGNVNEKKNPEIEKYFDESKGKSFKRSFSQAVQHVGPSVNKILVSQPKKVENGVLDYTKPGTPISSADLSKNNNSADIEMKVQKLVVGVDNEILHITEEIPKPAPLKVDDYFKESLERNTYRREVSEAFQELGNIAPKKNPEIEKYLETSTAKQSFQRTFSEAAQEVAPSINKILGEPTKIDLTELKELHDLRDHQRSRTSSIGSDSSRAHGKKLGIDKFFATSLYRNAYHRSPITDEIGSDANELSILEDDDLVSELDGDIRDIKQDGVGLQVEDDIRSNISEGGIKQDATFWRDFLKSERE